MNVALLVPLSRRLARTGLVDALTAHYGSPGRLADYRRQFERTTRTHYDPTPGGDGPTADGKRLIRGEEFASRVSGNVRPQDPGGAAMPIVAPRRITNDDVSNTTKLSGGGGGGRASVGPLQNFGGVGRGDQCWGHSRLMTTLGRRAGGGGGLAPFRCCRGGGGGGGLLPVDVTDAPTLSVEGPWSVPSRISVVLVDGTMAGDTPGRECPREDRDWRPQAGVMRPASVSVGGGSTVSPRSGGTWPSLDVAGRLLPVVPAGGGGVLPNWHCEPCWTRWPGCCRWPRWPMWDVVSTFSRSSGTVRAFGSG